MLVLFLASSFWQAYNWRLKQALRVAFQRKNTRTFHQYYTLHQPSSSWSKSTWRRLILRSHNQVKSLVWLSRTWFEVASCILEIASLKSYVDYGWVSGPDLRPYCIILDIFCFSITLHTLYNFLITSVQRCTSA